MVCLDSDVMIDFLRGEKYAINKIGELRDSEIELSTTAINAFELFKGALRLKQHDSKEIITNFLLHLRILDFNLDASLQAANIFENLRSKGELIDPLDLMIASIAIINNEPILTRNLSHFKRIPGLEIID